MQYPHARRTDFSETLHGTQVPDPYRWMEDIDSPETTAWVQAQNELTQRYLATIPQREAIKARMTELWNYEKFSAPYRKGGRIFYSHNDGLQNQSVLFWQETLASEPKILLDPNTLSADGTVALSAVEISSDGRRMAYSLSESGSDWVEWHVRDVDSGEDLPDVIRWSKFSGASWTKDSAGFFYAAYDEPRTEEAFKQANLNQKLYYHQLGTPQSADRLVYKNDDEPKWGFWGEVSDDGKYLIVSIRQGTMRQFNITLINLEDPSAPPIELMTGFKAIYGYVGNLGDTYYFFTDDSAPMNRVIAVDINNPAEDNWQTAVPQQAETLNNVSLVHGKFLATYLQDAKSILRVFDTQGKLVDEPAVPGMGTITGFGGSPDDTDVFFHYASFATPGTIYRYDVITQEVELFRAPQLNFNPEDYITKQVFYPSKDGTLIPMFISHRKDLAISPDTPLHLYAYGGFNIPRVPEFSVPYLTWMEMGGIFAVANLRGGGEYGKAWHEAGMKHNKQNVFDDFIAAAEYLIAEGYTSSPKLSISGRSNGGLLVGACITQRPDLFGAALGIVGVMDMLRFTKFTIGWAWVSDYGSPDDPAEFRTLLAYSPYHNVKQGTTYPPTMIITADHDDRVFPAHSFKFGAQMQWAQAGDNPILMRIESKAGHGAGKPVAKIIDDFSDQWAFLVRHLGMQ
ncbi:MAG TPA: S9 family peptidase [Chloroflexi bacterium]|nr:S9 family peptidase [Chloroflexota bacterium]